MGVFNYAILLWYKTCPRASHGTEKVSKASRYIFSILYLPLSSGQENV